MAQIPKGGLVKGPYKPICRDCAIYFSTTVSCLVFIGIGRIPTVDGRIPANQLRLVVYPMIFHWILYIPGGSPAFFHLQGMKNYPGI